MNDITNSKKDLSNKGVNAVFGIAGGIALMVLGVVLSKLSFLGPIVGAIVTIIGISGILSKSKSDKKGGAITCAVGIIILLLRVPAVSVIAGTVLRVGALASFGLGIWNGIKFLIGLKSRQ
ncbi:hypothetical protein AGMMS50212_13210 [Spirochaetia bacterium]|nr:hypothetical protein AGMMS50212_13210 [Spirochaetia bacterium]